MGHPPYYPCTKPEVLGVRGCIGKISSPTYPRDKTKIEYTSGGQPSFYELTFGVKSDPNPYSKMVLDYTIGPWSQSHSYKIELDEENEDTMEEKKGQTVNALLNIQMIKLKGRRSNRLEMRTKSI